MIPFATTTIRVSRVIQDPDTDGYDPTPAPTVVAIHVRAVVSTPSASVQLAGGHRVVTRTRITCDPADIYPGDRVTEEKSGQHWSVDSVQEIHGLGSAHMILQVRDVTGAT